MFLHLLIETERGECDTSRKLSAKRPMKNRFKKLKTFMKL